jgi:hypothetical protein
MAQSVVETTYQNTRITVPVTSCFKILHQICSFRSKLGLGFIYMGEDCGDFIGGVAKDNR